MLVVGARCVRSQGGVCGHSYSHIQGFSSAERVHVYVAHFLYIHDYQNATNGWRTSESTRSLVMSQRHRWFVLIDFLCHRV